ncbi:MAG: hypothetical protein GXC73_13570 [Chitinophagaceae bacterium]|nr:hypothetical protein [Chitinophagaceae bacterium]
MTGETPAQNNNEERFFETGYTPSASRFVLIDITLFWKLFAPCMEAVSAKIKRARIQILLSSTEWHRHYKSKSSGNIVLAESAYIEHLHELKTAKSLADQGYNILFAPKGIFQRNDKRFDIFIIKDHLILKADLKCITSKNPDTIAKRIKGGSHQASRVVIEIASDIDRKILIEALRSGVYKNELLREIFLFYKGYFYLLPVNLVTSKHIYSTIK